ncbi:MAG TPA: LysE family translocator [Noviherbaspirillum sp.]|jgi:threonine/homoserine/homoserine lactone efflux protein|uniref:LysE family translocator n=1 Tax=Noviherbaspirillum sp. TaxID=1926288 RepID=UPI002F958CB3
MIPVDVAAAFFATAILLGLAPGPDNIFVLTQSALRGPRAGVLVTLGLCTGLVVHTLLVAFGVAAVFAASDLAFTVLKLAGAAYLLYLAWQAFRAPAESIRLGSAAGPGGWALYRRGIVMNVTNPKVSIFFLAFLPQFADPARGPLGVQMMLLGALFMLATLLVFGGVALLAGAIGARLGGSARAQRVMNRVAGTVFALLALKLATTSR